MSDDSDPLDPERARSNPEEAVDALEERVLGGPDRRLDGGAPPDEDAAAHDVDLDPEDQGDADAVGPAPD